LLLISGTELATNKNLLPLQLFVDWVIGFSDITDDFIDITKIVHVIFAGMYSYDIFASKIKYDYENLVTGNCIRSKPQQKPKYGTVVDNSEDIEAVKEFDYIIEQLIVSEKTSSRSI